MARPKKIRSVMAQYDCTERADFERNYEKECGEPFPSAEIQKYYQSKTEWTKKTGTHYDEYAKKLPHYNRRFSLAEFVRQYYRGPKDFNKVSTFCAYFGMELTTATFNRIWAKPGKEESSRELSVVTPPTVNGDHSHVREVGFVGLNLIGPISHEAVELALDGLIQGAEVLDDQPLEQVLRHARRMVGRTILGK